MIQRIKGGLEGNQLLKTQSLATQDRGIHYTTPRTDAN